jgi:hypothetical protein
MKLAAREVYNSTKPKTAPRAVFGFVRGRGIEQSFAFAKFSNTQRFYYFRHGKTPVFPTHFPLESSRENKLGHLLWCPNLLWCNYTTKSEPILSGTAD